MNHSIRHISLKFIDSIVVRDWQIAFIELEVILRAHYDIVDVVVIKMKHQDFEALRALVIRKNESLSIDMIKKYIVDLLVNYKHLDEEISFVKSILKSSSEKILRKLLFEAFDQSVCLL